MTRSQYYPRVMLVEVDGTANQTAQFARYDDRDGAHLPTNMALVALKNDCASTCVYSLVDAWIVVAERENVWSNWQVNIILYMLSA